MADLSINPDLKASLVNSFGKHKPTTPTSNDSNTTTNASSGSSAPGSLQKGANKKKQKVSTDQSNSFELTKSSNDSMAMDVEVIEPGTGNSNPGPIHVRAEDLLSYPPRSKKLKNFKHLVETFQNGLKTLFEHVIIAGEYSF